jgi:hypothetical protein
MCNCITCRSSAHNQTSGSKLTRCCLGQLSWVVVDPQHLCDLEREVEPASCKWVLPLTPLTLQAVTAPPTVLL